MTYDVSQYVAFLTIYPERAGKLDHRAYFCKYSDNVSYMYVSFLLGVWVGTLNKLFYVLSSGFTSHSQIFESCRDGSQLSDSFH